MFRLFQPTPDPSEGGEWLPPDIKVLRFPSLCSECLRHRYRAMAAELDEAKPLAFFIPSLEGCLKGGVGKNETY